jgi:N-acyl-D-aspartate/D-glutamate deacylase
MNDSLQQGLLSDPLLAICSDGSPTGYHPRGHGTFARIIEEFVFNRQALTLEEAVRKMTSYPAQILKLADRGIIAPGMKADILLFHPKNVHETATFGDPLQLAEGFDWVMINGKVARNEGVLSDSLHGRFILPNK